MSDFQKEKRLVRDFYDQLDGAEVNDLQPVLRRFYDDHVKWRGYHPFNELHGPATVAAQFWAPIRTALTSLHRRMDVFMAGRNEIDGFDSKWVVSMGHLVGLFDQPLLGIPPTGKMAFLRYCEFNRVQDGRITDVAMYFDLPHLMIQAGLSPFPEQAGAHLVQPGPVTHDALLFDDQPREQGSATLDLINKMAADLGQWQGRLPLTEELRRTWAEDMIWWGPAGIGATYTIERYAQQHSGPFRAAFSDRSKTRHICRMAEGNFGGFFGWPNFTARLTGTYMGQEPTGKTGEFRVIDIYRRQGDKLAENWVFIDLPHFWAQQGVDILPLPSGKEY
jgi:predicted ester cyclase